MFGAKRRLEEVEGHIVVCNSRNDARIEKDNEIMLVLVKLSEGLAGHMKREEDLEKETRDAVKESNASLAVLLKEVTNMREASLIQHEKSQAESYDNINKIMTYVRDKYESTEKADDREKALKLQMSYIWGGVCLSVTSVIATVVLFGWLYVNVISPQNKQPVNVEVSSK